MQNYVCNQYLGAFNMKKLKLLSISILISCVFASISVLAGIPSKLPPPTNVVGIPSKLPPPLIAGIPSKLPPPVNSPYPIGQLA
jgi:hypothetical protein